jgi:hypothetical protein
MARRLHCYEGCRLLVGEESVGSQTLKLLSNSNHRLVGGTASPTRKAVSGTPLKS